MFLFGSKKENPNTTRTSVNYLRCLDDLDGRSVDNTAFIKISDFAQLNDEQLYAKLLEQYPAWLRAMHIN